MMQSFYKFAQSITPAGAKAQVEQLLKSGQMSKEQFEELSKQAREIMNRR